MYTDYKKFKTLVDKLDALWAQDENAFLKWSDGDFATELANVGLITDDEITDAGNAMFVWASMAIGSSDSLHDYLAVGYAAVAMGEIS